MRLPQTKLAQIKNWIHLAQAGLLFLAWALTIGVFTAQGKIDGRSAWYFGLCWLTIPILIYLTMVPMWSRARKFANVYAFATLDTLSIVLWLSGWASVTSYVVSGKGQGTSTDTNAKGCDNFKYGSANKCKLSEATIVFGVLIMLMFIPTAYVSFKAVMEYQRTGIMPNQGAGGASGMGVGGGAGAGTLGGSKPISSIEDDAFDSNMNARNDWEVDEFDHDEYHRDPRQGGIGGGSGSAGKNYLYQRAEVHDEDDDYVAAGGSHSRHHSSALPHHDGNVSYDDLSSARPTVPGAGPLGHQDTEYRSTGYR